MTFMFEPPLRLAGTPMVISSLLASHTIRNTRDGPADVIGYAALLPELNH